LKEWYCPPYPISSSKITLHFSIEVTEYIVLFLSKSGQGKSITLCCTWNLNVVQSTKLRRR